jgi:transposase-like protein
VRLVLESDRPIAQIAKDLGIHHEALRLWVRQAEADAGRRPEQPTSAAASGSAIGCDQIAVATFHAECIAPSM